VNEDMNSEDVTLPELSDARIDEIEDALFAAIGRERRRDAAIAERTRRARRGRIWLGAAGAAAVVVVAAVLAPSMPALLGSTGGASDASTAESAPESVPDRDLGGTFGGDGGSSTASEEGATTDPSSSTGEREIIATASAAVRVDDAEAAASRIGEIADAAGGYVEAVSVGGTEDGALVPFDSGGDGTMIDETSVPTSSSAAWITIRVPAASLTETTEALSEVGDVTASQIDRRDVTGEAVDLRARVTALQASVARLTDLVAQADSTADLIAAEEALSARQSDLESYAQQLKYLDEQVGMSTLTVTLTEPVPAVEADPAGFGDGIAAGWGGLLATLNGFVLALGFLLPWLAVAAVAALIVWGIRRAIRRRGRAVAPEEAATRD